MLVAKFCCLCQSNRHHADIGVGQLMGPTLCDATSHLKFCCNQQGMPVSVNITRHRINVMCCYGITVLEFLYCRRRRVWCTLEDVSKGQKNTQWHLQKGGLMFLCLLLAG